MNSTHLRCKTQLLYFNLSPPITPFIAGSKHELYKSSIHAYTYIHRCKHAFIHRDKHIHIYTYACIDAQYVHADMDNLRLHTRVHTDTTGQVAGLLKMLAM